MVGVAIGRCAPAGAVHGLAQQALDRLPTTGLANPTAPLDEGEGTILELPLVAIRGDLPPRVKRYAP